MKTVGFLLGGLFLLLCLGGWNSGIQVVEAQAEDDFEVSNSCSDKLDFLWRTCEEICRTCMGRESGLCETGEARCSYSKQCVCSGGNIQKSVNGFDVLLCSSGM